MSPAFCFSPAHECPECSSGCCYAPDKIHLPPTMTLYQLKRSNICSHTPSSLTGTGYELKILKEHSKAGKLACEAAHFQPHRYNMLLFGFDVILLMGENDLFTMISLCIVWCLDIYITSPLQVNFYNGFYYRDCDYFAGLISTQLPQLMSWTLNAHQS